MKQASYILAIVALLASCGQGDILVDTFEPAPQAPRRIGFDTFVDKATRAAGTNSTALNDYYPTFNVYGWKTVGGEVTCVFNNIPVEHFADNAAGTVVYTAGKPSDEWAVTTPFTAGWYYENVRYWDQMASNYQFSAYAPATASSDVSCTADGVIKIGTDAAPVTVDPKNLKATPATTLSFTGFDKDYMTASSTAQTSPVGLTFSHLQAKLNLRIRLADDVTTAQNVSVKKIQVHNLGDKGYYTNVAGVGISGWTITTPSADYVPKVETAYSLNAATNYDDHYVLEQLIIPQTITKSTAAAPSLTEYAEACVYVEYTIGDEVFKSYTPLANLFTSNDTYDLKGGNQYTLNINIGPEPIHFKAEVAEWADAIDEDLDIE